MLTPTRDADTDATATARGHAPVAVAVVGACVLLAVISLAIPSAMGFDPWAWVVWGREVASLELDTTGGPSWKPLPVVVTTVASPLGDLAPDVWLVVARTAGLLLVVGTYRLATRLAGPAAGVVAAALLVLTPQTEPRLVRIVLEGHAAPMAAAMAVWAIDRHLARRPLQALLLGTGVALVRPEAWPFLALYGWWAWRSIPRSRPLVVGAAVVVPLLWLGGDWWGSGDPFHGAAEAQVDSGAPFHRLWHGLDEAAEIAVVPAWLLAAAALALHRRHRWTLVVLASGVVAWCAVVVAMAYAFGYAALGRFMLPAAAVLCVLAGVGAVAIVAAVPAGRWRVVTVTAMLLVSLGLSAARIARFEDVLDEVVDRGRVEADIPTAIDAAGGVAVVAACPVVSVDGNSLLRPAFAWELDVPLHRVESLAPPRPGAAFVMRAGAERAYARAVAPARPTVSSDRWLVYTEDCPSP